MVLGAVGKHIGSTGPLRVVNRGNRAQPPAKVNKRVGFAILDNSYP